ncbi:heme-copper oxidase subunit III [Flavobacterium sp. RHBU_24]|uniref:cytochrome c oxidase subunit 3 n=1 Tax=Flavobacterium sp. RHBU_24 TaxID=3391185 RepID=UPI003984E971
MENIKMSAVEYAERSGRSKKMLLWFAMISIVMMFAGLTSAYVVSSTRRDWLNDLTLPVAFVVSTILLLLSSGTFILAKNAVKKGNHQAASGLLLLTLALGVGFVISQFYGFSQIIDMGYYLTGEGSTVTASFIYVIIVAHIGHVFAGLVVLSVVIYNHFKHKYNPSQTLGIELGAMFWHFLDILWLYLFLFFYFY